MVFNKFYRDKQISEEFSVIGEVMVVVVVVMVVVVVVVIGSTRSDKYGVKINAIPAATLQAPTPTLRMAVGYNSAV